MGRKDLGNLREVVASSMTIPFSTTFSMLYTSSVSGLQPCTPHAAAPQLYTSSVKGLQPCTRHAATPQLSAGHQLITMTPEQCNKIAGGCWECKRRGGQFEH